MVVGRAAVLRPLSWQRAVRGKAGHGPGDAAGAGARRRCQPFPVPGKLLVRTPQPFRRCPGLREPGERAWKKQRIRAGGHRPLLSLGLGGTQQTPLLSLRLPPGIRRAAEETPAPSAPQVRQATAAGAGAAPRPGPAAEPARG